MANRTEENLSTVPKMPSNVETVWLLASDLIFVPEKIKILDRFNPGWDENIKKGGTIFDFGCGKGDVGLILAARRNCSLVRADICEDDSFCIGAGKIPFVSLERNSLNVFDGENKVDTILLFDVLQHIGFGNGWNKTTKSMDLEGKIGDWLPFLKGVATALKPDGKIVIVTTHPSGDLVRDERVRKYVLKDSEIGDRVVFVN